MNRDEFEMPVDGARRSPVVRWRGGERSAVDDWLTEEVPVAFEFNGISHAVMLATPADLEDFALGFGLAEGIFASPADLYGCDVVAAPQGLTVSMEVSARSFAGLKERRRTLAGRTGCGVCGTESLDQVLRPVPMVEAGVSIASSAIARAMRSMHTRQHLNQATGSVHAAAWCSLDGDGLALREDVGRHNALDKLIGALARSKVDTRAGFIAVTSRASIEMVQKAAVAGAPLLAAVSAPTALAVATAEQAGMSLVGLVRGDDLVIYARPERVVLEARKD
ncbi:MAG TPA: formate dehydrogenase accessory sulfurtransferase FdhD [Burkholderiaceae bacterium]